MEGERGAREKQVEGGEKGSSEGKGEGLRVVAAIAEDLESRERRERQSDARETLLELHELK